jgi:hypothetical protein
MVELLILVRCSSSTSGPRPVMINASVIMDALSISQLPKLVIARYKVARGHALSTSILAASSHSTYRSPCASTKPHPLHTYIKFKTICEYVANPQNVCTSNLPYRHHILSLCDSMKAARVNKQGGIDEIEVVDIPVPSPKPDEILIKTEWAGVNFSKSMPVCSPLPLTQVRVLQSTLTSEGECILVLRRLPLARRPLARSFPYLVLLMCRSQSHSNWSALAKSGAPRTTSDDYKVRGFEEGAKVVAVSGRSIRMPVFLI